MRRAISAILPFAMMSLFIVALVGCGADIKAENERLKLEVQKLKEEIQKAAEKEATIGYLNAENEALKKQIENLKARLTKKKK